MQRGQTVHKIKWEAEGILQGGQFLLPFPYSSALQALQEEM
jgi:hypothetical protein